MLYACALASGVATRSFTVEAASQGAAIAVTRAPLQRAPTASSKRVANIGCLRKVERRTVMKSLTDGRDVHNQTAAWGITAAALLKTL